MLTLSLPSSTVRARSILISGLTVFMVFTTACNRESSNTSQPDSSTTNGSTSSNNTPQTETRKSNSSLLSSVSDAPIHWKAWNKEAFKQAKLERKTVFTIIGSGSDGNTLDLLKHLHDSPEICAILNKNHVSVLIDTNCDPAMEFLAASLCMTTRAPVFRPFLVWFSYEGHPISWNAVSPDMTAQSDEVIARMCKTVNRLWLDDPEYVLQNSETDFKRRIDQQFIMRDAKPDPDAALKGIRQISSFYDSTSHNIDRIGKINPARFANLLVKASVYPTLLDSQKERYKRIAELAANKKILYGLIDPIDGGVYDGVQRVSTSLPSFTKSLKNQALSMDALYNLYQTTKTKSYLTAANNIKAFTEKNLRLENGDYRQGIVYASTADGDSARMWTIEELQKSLTAEELRVCTLAFGILELGNIPLLDDHNRNYFKKNTLTWKTTPTELAKLAQLDLEKIDALLGSAMKKLSETRSASDLLRFKEDVASAGSLALYTSSLITAYRATGDQIHLKDAQRIFTQIKSNFIDANGKLQETRFKNQLSTAPACATTYSLVCDAALDLHQVTLVQDYLDHAQALHADMNSSLKAEGEYLLEEQNFDHHSVNYTVIQNITVPNINNFSSWALAWSNSSRLSHYADSEELTKEQSELADFFHSLSMYSPFTSIDYLNAYIGQSRSNVYFSGKVSPDLLQAAIRGYCNIIALNKKSSHSLGKEVPDGSVAVTLEGKLIGITNQSSELNKWLK